MAAGAAGSSQPEAALVRLLLDTHLLIWSVFRSHRLPPALRPLLEDGSNAVFYSAASIWEAAIKHRLRRGDFDVPPGRLDEGARLMGFTEIPIRAAVAVHVASLPMHHRDPFDRLLVAQAVEGQLALYTSDPWLPPYGPFVTLVA